MNNTLKRSITGILLAAIVIGSVCFHVYTFITLVLLINMTGLYEFYSLHHSYHPRKWEGFTLSTLIFIITTGVYTGILDVKWLTVIPLAGFPVLIAEIYRDDVNPFQSLAYTFFGLLYVTMPAILLILIGYAPLSGSGYASGKVLAFIFIVWASDVGAYFTGKTFGRHTMFKRVSPNKTWEGYAGGFVFSAFTAWLFSRYNTGYSMTELAAVTVIVMTVGVYGDLFKSVMKRTLGVKDSGSLLPGHGGILDRFDSMLASAPFVFCMLCFHN